MIIQNSMSQIINKIIAQKHTNWRRVVILKWIMPYNTAITTEKVGCQSPL
jgi:hypothetical protein